MDYVRVYGRAGIEGGVLGEGSAALSLNPHPRLRRECGTRKFNGVRSDGVEGCATRPVAHPPVLELAARLADRKGTSHYLVSQRFSPCTL